MIIIYSHYFTVWYQSKLLLPSLYGKRGIRMTNICSH